MKIEFNEEIKKEKCLHYESAFPLIKKDRVCIGSVDCVLGCKHNGRRSGFTYVNCASPEKIKEMYRYISEQLKEKMHG